MSTLDSETAVIVDRSPIEAEFIPGDGTAADFDIDFVADDECAARAIADNEPWQALVRQSAERPHEVVEVMVFRPVDADGNPVVEPDEVDIEGLMRIIDSLDPANCPKPTRKCPPPLPPDVIQDIYIEIDLDDPDIIEIVEEAA